MTDRPGLSRHRKRYREPRVLPKQPDARELAIEQLEAQAERQAEERAGLWLDDQAQDDAADRYYERLGRDPYA